MSAPLREARVGEQIKDLFILIDPVVGSIGVELGEAVSASEFDDLTPVLAHVCARHCRIGCTVACFLFIQINWNECLRNNVVITCFTSYSLRSGLKRSLGLLAELVPSV